jgi:hypothetical protein
MKTKTELLIKALRHLSYDQKGKVATETIIEASNVLDQLNSQMLDHGLTMSALEDIVTDDNRSHKAKVLAFNYVLRKAQP